MNREFATKVQKVIWHSRWGLLLILIIMNIYAFFSELTAVRSISMNGFCLALYFLLAQVEGYFECKSQCDLKGK